MQIRFNTGVCTLLMVKVPEDAHNFDIDGTDFYFNCQFGDVRFGNPRRLIMLCKKYQFIGLSHELTEEQCAGFVDPACDKWEKYWRYKDYEDFNYYHETAKESFESLLRHIKVYNINPHKHPINMGTMDADSYNEMIHLYDHYQERTGIWAVLRLE